MIQKRKLLYTFQMKHVIQDDRVLLSFYCFNLLVFFRTKKTRTSLFYTHLYIYPIVCDILEQILLLFLRRCDSFSFVIFRCVRIELHFISTHQICRWCPSLSGSWLWAVLGWGCCCWGGSTGMLIVLHICPLLGVWAPSRMMVFH